MLTFFSMVLQHGHHWLEEAQCLLHGKFIGKQLWRPKEIQSVSEISLEKDTSKFSYLPFSCAVHHQHLFLLCHRLANKSLWEAKVRSKTHLKTWEHSNCALSSHLLHRQFLKHKLPIEMTWKPLFSQAVSTQISRIQTAPIVSVDRRERLHVSGLLNKTHRAGASCCQSATDSKSLLREMQPVLSQARDSINQFIKFYKGHSATHCMDQCSCEAPAQFIPKGKISHNFGSIYENPPK